MHAVLIVIHLFVAIGLVSLILLQRSEGGALGMGGGPGGLMTGRQAGNVITRATAGLAVLFFITSLSLTFYTNATAERGSVVDVVGEEDALAPSPAPAGDDSLLAAPATTPESEVPAAPAPAQPTGPASPASPESDAVTPPPTPE